MNVLVPLLEGRQKRNLLSNGTIIDVVRKSVNGLQDSFFRAHALSVSPDILGASPVRRSGPTYKECIRRAPPGRVDLSRRLAGHGGYTLVELSR